MEDISSFLKVMADPTRLNIVGLLAQEPRSGDELAALLDVKPSTISHHADCIFGTLLPKIYDCPKRMAR